MTLSTQRRQIVLAIGTEGVFTAAALSASNAKMVVFEPVIEYDIAEHERRPSRVSLGSLASVKGKQMARVTFSCDIRGSGTAGVAPSIGKAIRCCGFSETANTGSAAIGTVVKDPKSTGSGAAPALAGTYTGTKSGRLEIQITEVVTDTEITILATFYPGDGSAPSTDSFTQDSSSAVELAGVADGVTFDFGDPDNSTAGYVAGDRYVASLTSDQEISVQYDPISTSIPCADIALNQDGRLHKLHSCRGTFTLEFPEAGAPGRINFEFTGVPANTGTTSDSSAGLLDASPITGVGYEETVPPAFKGVTATLHSGTPACFNSLSIDIGNTIAEVPCATATAGMSAARITARNVTGEIDPEAKLFATKNWHTGLFAGTAGNFIAVAGSTAGNIFRIDAPRVQISEVSDEDRDGITVDALALRFCEPEYDSGGDYAEISLTFL